MAEVKTVSKSYKVENGKVIMTEQLERTMTRADLENVRMGNLNRIAQLDKQIADLKVQRTNVVQGIAELDEMIAELPLELTEDSEG